MALYQSTLQPKKTVRKRTFLIDQEQKLKINK